MMTFSVGVWGFVFLFILYVIFRSNSNKRKLIEEKQALKKILLDRLNQVRSEISNETNVKLARTMSAYRAEKLLFLNRHKKELETLLTRISK